MNLNSICFYIMCFCTFVITTGAHAENAGVKTVYEAYLNNTHYDQYMDFLKGRDPMSIDFSKEQDADRMVLEPFIFQIAPVIGGCECEIKYKPYNIVTPHQRSISEVAEAHVVGHPIAGFGGDSRLNNDNIALTEPILDGKDFYVGFYTYAERDDILNITDIKEIKNLKFVTVELWEIDNKLIDDYGFEKISADDWQPLLNMLVAGRADVVMQPFQPTDDLSMVDEESKRKFLPIPHMKIAFNQPRQYFISTKHPDGQKFLEAINKGILILKKKGLLKKWHETAGVINKATDDFEAY